MQLIRQIGICIALLLDCGAILAREWQTAFSKTPFYSVQEMHNKREVQKALILEKLAAVDQGQILDRFGSSVNGLQLGFFLLDTDNSTTTAAYAVLVLRNSSGQNLQFYGNEDDIFQLHAIGDSNVPLQRTSRGESFGGRPLKRVRSGIALLSIPDGGQLVYEINLGELFKLVDGKQAVLTAKVGFQDSNSKQGNELIAENVILVPKPNQGEPSVFDPPQLPPSMATRTAWHTLQTRQTGDSDPLKTRIHDENTLTTSLTVIRKASEPKSRPPTVLTKETASSNDTETQKWSYRSLVFGAAICGAGLGLFLLWRKSA